MFSTDVIQEAKDIGLLTAAQFISETNVASNSDIILHPLSIQPWIESIGIMAIQGVKRISANRDEYRGVHISLYQSQALQFILDPYAGFIDYHYDRPNNPISYASPTVLDGFTERVRATYKGVMLPESEVRNGLIVALRRTWGFAPSGTISGQGMLIPIK